MTSVLEVNDCALSLYTGDKLAYAAPAVALVQPGGILFGDAALQQARIHPRQANQQYLARLNADPLLNPTPQAANHADLLFLHLQEIVPLVDGDLVLAVPGIMSADQLGVLLGILQETGVEVSGFVDAATAAASTVSLPPTAYHVDLHWQRACITRLAVDSEVCREGVDVAVEAGFSNLLDSWINVIADRFVRDTRFDPLHAAATEQQLYNQVYDWVLDAGSATASSPAAEIGIDIYHQDHVRHVDIPRTVLEEKAQQRFARIFEVLPGAAHVAVSARCAKLPGFLGALERAGHPFSRLEDQAIAIACARHMGSIRSSGESLRLISKLPGLGDAPAAPDFAQPASDNPTHLLDCTTARAQPLGITTGDRPFTVQRAAHGPVLASGDESILVNGKPARAGLPLRSGDEITHGRARYLLIRVDD